MIRLEHGDSVHLRASAIGSALRCGFHCSLACLPGHGTVLVCAVSPDIREHSFGSWSSCRLVAKSHAPRLLGSLRDRRLAEHFAGEALNRAAVDASLLDWTHM